MSSFSASRRTVITGGVAALATIGTPSPSRADTQPYLPALRRPRFDRERFIADCVKAHRADGMEGVREVLSGAISDHRAVLADLGEPTEAGIVVLHSSPSFTIFAAHWTPQMNLLPHDHMMKALIGIYSGREDNILWRREAAGMKRTTPVACSRGTSRRCRPMRSTRSPIRSCGSRQGFTSTTVISSALIATNGTPRRSQSRPRTEIPLGRCLHGRTNGIAFRVRLTGAK